MSKLYTEHLNKIAELRESVNKQYEEYKKTQDPSKKPNIDTKSIDTMERTLRNLHSDYSMGRASIRESISSTDTARLIPKIIEGKLREAAEPEYLGTRFMQTINVDGGSAVTYLIPVIGEVRAFEVNEMGRYNEDQPEMTVIEDSQLEVKVKKIGAKVSISEEAINDSTWDILGINIKKMGRAMARYKEELIFNNFTSHGHTVFNNEVRGQFPEFGTTGRDEDGNFNDTLSVEDMLDLVLANMGNGFTPTDLIMHPLTWVIFARNSMIGNGLTYGALGGSHVHPYGAVQGTPGFAGLAANGEGQKLIMTPEQVQNRLPVPLTLNFSPFVNIDKETKRFDMYCIDRTEVGILVQREALSTDNWTDPERDIRLLKSKERYGVGILNQGRAITVARNLAVAPTYPVPPTVRIQNK